MNLICNHFDKDPLKQRPMPIFIGGPKNLTVHISKKYDKMIYIFGEYHSDKIDCDVRFGDESSKETWDKPNSKKMRVEYFLSEFIRTTDDFIDIFAEFPIVSKETGKYDDKFTAYPPNIRMNKLLDNFKECLQRNTRTQDCSLARIHYFDIRYYDDKGIKSVSNSISYFFHNLNYHFTFYSGDEQIKQLKIFINDQIIKDVLNELAEPDEDKFKKIWVNYLTDLSHNVKELDRLQKDDPKMKDTILHFIEKEITENVMKYRTSWLKNVRIIFDNHKHTVSDFLSAFENIHQTIGIINALYADLYTLLRVFKTFNMSEMKEKAYTQATDQPVKAHNIIIYAGDLHSQVYRKFLTEVLDFDKIEVAGKEEPYGQLGEEMYCIDMKDITQPLFSKYHELVNPDKDKKEIGKPKDTVKPPKEDDIEEKRQRDLDELKDRWDRKREEEEDRKNKYLEEKRVKDILEEEKRQRDLAELYKRWERKREEEEDRKNKYLEEKRVKDILEEEKRQRDLAELYKRWEREEEKRQRGLAELYKRWEREGTEQEDRKNKYLEEKRVKDTLEEEKRQRGLAELKDRWDRKREEEEEWKRKHSSKKVQEKRPDEQIKVLTYNVLHEISSISKCGADRCIKNIGVFIDTHANDCDFIGIQEYIDIPKMTQYSETLRNMQYSYKNPTLPSQKDYAPITFYNPEKYTLDKSCNTMKFGFNGPLSRGIQINFFNDNLCVINVHAGHLTKDTKNDDGKTLVQNDITTFDKSLKSFLESKKCAKECKDVFIHKLQTYRIIMLGDMNSEIKHFDHITIEDKVIKLVGRTEKLTCCGDRNKMNGVNIDSGTFDHILNSFSDKIQTTVYENLEYHSDHNPVISTITI